MNERATGVAVAERWLRQGQLHQQLLGGARAATVVNHVARYVCTRPDVRVRFAERLLAAGASLAPS